MMVKNIQQMMNEVGVCSVGRAAHRRTKTFREMVQICGKTESGIAWFMRKRSYFGKYMTKHNRALFNGVLTMAEVVTSWNNDNWSPVPTNKFNAIYQAINQLGIKTKVDKQ